MGPASLVCLLVLCLRLTQGVPHQKGFGPPKGGGVVHHHQAPAPQPQNVFIQGVHAQLPDCAPEINSITQVTTITRTRDVFTTQIVPEIVYRTAYTTNVVTQTSNTVETVTTSVLIRSNVQEVQTITKLATAYTAVPTTFTETTTRTQFDVQYVTEIEVVTRTVAEGKEEIVPLYVTQTAHATSLVTRATTSTIFAASSIDVQVTFTESVTVPVITTVTQTLPAPAITSTIVNYVTQLIQVTQTVPVERLITHRQIHTVTQQAPGGLYPAQQTVYQTICPIG